MLKVKVDCSNNILQCQQNEKMIGVDMVVDLQFYTSAA